MRYARRPETARIDLRFGDWIVVKKHVTTGEERAMFDRMVRVNGTAASIDPVKVGMSKVLTYLVDWGGFLDASGKPLVILDQKPEVVESILNALDPEDFAEINEAVTRHETEAMAEREKEKNGQSGETASSAISPSAA